MRATTWILVLAAFSTSAFGRAQRGGDRGRVVDKASIVATRPPDGDHGHPLELESLVPIEHSPLIVSLHRGPGRGDELAIWAKVAGGYRRLEKFVVDEPGLGSYAPVTSFNYGYHLFLVVSFVGSGTAYSHDDTVLVVDQGGDVPRLARVPIESPIERFRGLLAAEESAQDFGVMLRDEQLEWSFGVRKAGEPECCPTEQMHGSLAVCREERHDDATDRWVSTWRMVPEQPTREPVGRATIRTPAEILRICPIGNVLPFPDPSGPLGKGLSRNGR